MGIDPRTADEMELFEIACAFGHNRPKEEAAEKDGAPEEDWDPIRARVEAKAKGLPEPKAPPVQARRRRRRAG